VVDEPFEDLMAMLDHPVFVVTTQDNGQPSGCLVSFANQASVNPPGFLVGIAKSSHAFEAASRSQHLAVHVLSRQHRGLAELFGDQTRSQFNNFDRCSWRAGPQGMPILDDAIAWFVGRTVGRLDIGDHMACLLEPVATWAPECSEDPLYLSDFDDVDPGHETSHRLFDRAPGDATHRYGVRFTLDGL
jgi:flavin reductase (DIM6/NTAB) family NADH-FMN oxidoreductase RutF